MCYPLSCDPPSRGGIRMHIRRESTNVQDFGTCTVGYNVRASNNWSWWDMAGDQR